MKTFETAAEVLQNARHFHQLAASFYQQLELIQQDERGRMLLQHLARHECNRQEQLDEFLRHVGETELATWIQYTLEEVPERFLSQLPVSENMTVAEIQSLGQRVESYTEDLYGGLAATTSCRRLHDVFTNLRDQQLQEKQSLTRASANLDWDI